MLASHLHPSDKKLLLLPLSQSVIATGALSDADLRIWATLFIEKVWRFTEKILYLYRIWSACKGLNISKFTSPNRVTR